MVVMIRLFKAFSILLGLFIAHYGKSQSNMETGRVIVEKNPGGYVETFNLEKSNEVEGSYYLNPEWQIGTINLYDGRVIEKMPLKYNMRDDFMHILDQNEEIRALKFDKIKSFEWFNVISKKYVKYVNCLDYDIDGTKLIGFAQILSSGDIGLLKYNYLELREGNYSITHDAGQRNDEYRIKGKRYIVTDGKLNPADKKKEIIKLLSDKEDEVTRYIKANHLNLKEDDHLISLIDYYNTI